MSNLTPKKYRRKVTVTCGESMTEQHHRESCDIHVILKKFRDSGQVEHLAKYQGDYGDFFGVDYHEAQNIIAEANSMFETIPARTRELFNNSPGEFLNWIQDPANAQEAYDLGFTESPPLDESPDPTPTPKGKGKKAPEDTQERSGDE